MNEKVLPPIKEEKAYFDKLEELIRQIFRDYIYLPIAKEAKAKVVFQNEKENPLVSAIRSDTIHFDRGVFSGKFSSSTSKELRSLGAVFDKRSGTFRLPMSKLPGDVIHAIQASANRFQQTAKEIETKLSKIVPDEIAQKLKSESIFDTVLYKTDQKIIDGLKGMVVSPQLSKESRAKLSKEYTQNLQKYIREFTEKEIVTLRKDISETVEAGGRYEGMVDVIQKRYQVSANKAKFLARQETGLMMAKFKEVRYQDAGVNEYIWRCVSNPKDTSPKQHTPGYVRYYHGVLDKTRQRFDQPPVTDANGKRNNPGEDYNCRCTARPIVKF